MKNQEYNILLKISKTYFYIQLIGLQGQENPPRLNNHHRPGMSV